MSDRLILTVRSPQGKWFLAGSGMAGFLCPPGHPMHLHCIEERAYNGTVRASLALDSAEEWVPAEVRRAARAVLGAWVPLPLEHPDVVAWVRQVLGYFRGCYRNPVYVGGREWHADKLLINPRTRIEGTDEYALRDPVEWADEHAGVHTIRRYYPAFVPTSDDFASAKWGT